MRETAKRLRWRLQPGRFVPVRCGIAPLADEARPVADRAALVAGSDPVAFCELAPAAETRLRAAFTLGAPSHPGLPDRSPVPPVRLYRLQGETRIFGKGLFLREGAVRLLPVLEFCELGRPDYPAHRLSLAIEGESATARLPATERHVAEPCLYVAQSGETIWGHWLVDVFPRLVLGLSLPARCRVVIDADAPAFAEEFLARAGVPPSRVLRHDKFRQTLVVRDLYVPSFPRYGDAFSPLVNLAWGLLPASGAPARRRLYVSRSGGPGGSTIRNAREIEMAARARGYRILHAERFDLANKARLFSEASHVVGEFGSGLHNTVFSRAGTRVAVLQSEASASYVQVGIGAERGQPTGLVYGPAAEGGRAFSLPPELFREALDRMEG